MTINLTLIEALAVLRQYDSARVLMRPGDREMMDEAERVVAKQAKGTRDLFLAAALGYIEYPPVE